MPSSRKTAATNADTTNPRMIRLLNLSQFEVLTIIVFSQGPLRNSQQYDCPTRIKAAIDGPTASAYQSSCRVRQQASDEHLYSITSSARPRSGSGKVMPRVLAVLRLMNSSTFVTCCTASSAGL